MRSLYDFALWEWFFLAYLFVVLGWYIVSMSDAVTWFFVGLELCLEINFSDLAIILLLVYLGVV